MENRLFPLSRELFEKIIEPNIYAYYKRQGRPPNQGHYLFFCGVLYVLRTGIRWRDLPECFGPWSTLYMRFKRWSENGLFWSLLYKLQQQKRLNIEVVWVDSTTIAVHRHGGGCIKKKANKLLGVEGGDGVRKSI